MKKLFLSTIALYVAVLQAFSQSAPTEATTYQYKPLSLEEINLTSSYYTQNGNHSAVTGGIGSEKVVDFSNGFDLQFIGWDGFSRKHTLTTGLGIDYHSSASSAWVSETGASKKGGTRIYPSLNWTMEDLKKGTTVGAGLYYSAEYNYHSFGINAEYAKKNKKNGELSDKLNIFLDRVTMIYPTELASDYLPTTVVYSGASGSSSEGGSGLPKSGRYTFSNSLTYSHVINKRLQGSLTLDLVGQGGYLGLPFHRVYFSNTLERVEALPSERFKLPVGARLNYFIGDNIILRGYYRYYIDDWGITAHTASLEVPVKITPFFSVAPFFRYYTQTQSNYFAPYMQHKLTDQYYTSNYAYAAFSSNYFGVNLRIAPPNGLFKSKLSALEIRYGHYTQTTDLLSDVLSVDLKFK